MRGSTASTSFSAIGDRRFQCRIASSYGGPCEAFVGGFGEAGFHCSDFKDVKPGLRIRYPTGTVIVAAPRGDGDGQRPLRRADRPTGALGGDPVPSAPHERKMQSSRHRRTSGSRRRPQETRLRAHPRRTRPISKRLFGRCTLTERRPAESRRWWLAKAESRKPACTQPTAHCPLPTAHCPLPTAHCPTRRRRSARSRARGFRSG